MPGTQAQKVIFTALLLAQLAPASTVTDELGLAAAEEAALLLALVALVALVAAGALEELLDPPLLQARPVMAASAAMPPAARGACLLRVLVPSVLIFIGGNSFVSQGRGCLRFRAMRPRGPRQP
jgi:hypothetical protein